MKERPILFSGPMVRAILFDIKTKTRREVKKLLGFGQITQFGQSDTKGFDWHFRDKQGRWHDISTEKLLKANPYGQPGDRLWVRETFAEVGCIGKPIDWFEYHYKADYTDGIYTGYADMCFDRWKPSIHMPREASRIMLEMTDVRVERLRDITDSDAISEGIESFRPVPGDGPPETRYRDYTAEEKFKHGKTVRKYQHYTPRPSFFSLWESINGKDSVISNPWVWVITFKRL
ncbi:MAG TPA: hypothetical protein DCF33_05410 [Saprospirales bacterium]|nr:hypothetical protein [Saprospirales bacterium]